MDALFAQISQRALGVLEATHRRGPRVPSGLGVVGFDDLPETAYSWPPQTTVWQNPRQLGGMAVQHIGRMIAASHGEGASMCPEVHQLAPRLIGRLRLVRT
jgi:LacI family transcriptional regulator